MKARLNYIFLLCLTLLVVCTSCEDLIEVSRPRTQLIRATVFEDDETAVAAVSALYSGLTAQSGNTSGIPYMAALSSDELVIGQVETLVQFYKNEVLSINTNIETAWNGSYNAIYVANSIIEGLENSDKVSVGLKNQLLGEAKFFRAFYHFYLVNLFGDVPYITATDYRVNGLVSRVTVPIVYESIISDLLEAKALLADDYAFSQNERVRVNKWVGAAMLARVYLFQEDWVHAEEQATTVINKTSLYNLLGHGNLNKVFLKNSSETIWQLIPPNPQKYTTEGGIFNNPIYSAGNARISDELFNAFEASDDRRDEWIGIGNDVVNTWYYPLKYKETYSDTTGADEYSTVFRLAEQYLIRAEARAKQGKLVGDNSAASDINIIRNRAGLLPTAAVSEAELLSVIEHERRVELFTEWGHRWLDLNRTGRSTAVLSLIKTEWDDTDVLYPIPYIELQLNPNMTQNGGY